MGLQRLHPGAHRRQRDQRFHAFDAETGALVGEYQKEAGGYASPATFEVNDRQYVVIAAGGGGRPGTKPGDAYYCFALPKGRAHPGMPLG